MMVIESDKGDSVENLRTCNNQKDFTAEAQRGGEREFLLWGRIVQNVAV
jgi:hypothetical protein